jgi:NAD(P)-dependent dehydrogenase (short-subunit alcohol dehydrogenase family)
MGDKVLVTCASGKAGLECCRALVDAGFDVYGTSRTSTGGKKISAVGAKPVIADYVSELPKALRESGAKKLLFITDYFKAGKSSVEAEYQQGGWLHAHNLHFSRRCREVPQSMHTYPRQAASSFILFFNRTVHCSISNE